jgi:hydrogenase expression/formation protein HypC
MCLGVPGKVLAVEDDELRMARIEFGGIVKEACLAYVPEARPGDYVIVHAGFAISRVDEEQARQVFAYLAEINGLEDPVERKS